MSGLLTGHPEAATLLAEASHRRALARISVAHADQAFATAQAARLGYEELRHRLDPRLRRTVGFGVGLVALVLLGAGLTLLDVIELGGMWSLSADLAATAMWLAGAWLAALASRERHWQLVIAGVVAAVLLSLLLMSLHGLVGGPGSPASRESLLFGALVGVALFVVVVGTSVLMAHMEPGSLFWARRRWHLARAAHEAAVRLEQDDREAMAIATEAWLSLVRTQVSTVADDEHLVQETVALATALLEIGRPQLPVLSHRLGVQNAATRGGLSLRRSDERLRAELPALASPRDRRDVRQERTERRIGHRSRQDCGAM